MPAPALENPFGIAPLPAPPMPAPVLEDPSGIAPANPPCAIEVKKPEEENSGGKRNPRKLRSGEAAILAALDQPVSLEFIEVPLLDVVEALRQAHRIIIKIDRRAMREAGVDIGTPITCAMRGLSLRSALDLILREEDLAWTIASDVLLVTTPEEARTRLITRVYDVSDLLTPVEDHAFDPTSLPTTSAAKGWPIRLHMNQGLVGMMGVKDDVRASWLAQPGLGYVPTGGSYVPSYRYRETARPDAELEDLIRLLTRIVAPLTWEDCGGPGSIDQFDRSIVVSQTRDVLRRLETLLEDLRGRKRSAPAIAVDARWLLLDSDRLDELLPPNADLTSMGARIAVDAKALERLTREVPGFRGRIVCLSGQRVFLAAGERRSVVSGAVQDPPGWAGYRPTTTIPNVGVVLGVSASLPPGEAAALLHVHSTVTGWRTPEPPAQTTNPAPADALTEQPTDAHTPDSTTSLQIDRVNMPTHELAATLRVPLGKPVLVGGLTLAPHEDAAATDDGGGPRERKQLYLVVTTSRVATQP